MARLAQDACIVSEADILDGLIMSMLPPSREEPPAAG
jgi:hypothetical protein